MLRNSLPVRQGRRRRQLRHIIRRMVLKRCIYGVDKNPMAVELAKVALWLHTFTVGAPLSFLDHHLRCGDSLFGSWVKKGIDKVQSNHAELAAALMGEEESESASETETSSSEEEDDETVTTRSKPSKGMMPMRSKR